MNRMESERKQDWRIGSERGVVHDGRGEYREKEEEEEVVVKSDSEIISLSLPFGLFGKAMIPGFSTRQLSP